MSDSLNNCIVLSSGGTGGHVYPACSLAAELKKRNHTVVMMTDQRGFSFQNDLFSFVFTCFMRKNQGKFGSALKLLSLGKATLQCLWFLKKIKPQAVVGFGGYPSIPAVWAAQFLRIPTLIHEQNAVLGQANRLVAGRVKGIAVSFDSVQMLPVTKPIFKTGTPVREEIIKARQQEYVAYKPESN